MTYCIERKPRLIEDSGGFTTEAFVIWDLDTYYNPNGNVILEELFNDAYFTGGEDPMIRKIGYVLDFDAGVNIVQALSGTLIRDEEDFDEDEDPWEGDDLDRSRGYDSEDDWIPDEPSLDEEDEEYLRG